MSEAGIKNDQEKPALALLPIISLTEVGKVMTFGAKKYSAHNWLGGLKFTRLASAALRHLFSWLSGEENDPESGLNHLAHCGACVLMLLELALRKRADLDDRYKEVTK